MHRMIGMTAFKYCAFPIPDLQSSGWSGNARLSLAIIHNRPGPSGLGLLILVVRRLAGVAATPSG